MTGGNDTSAATIAPLLPCPFCGNKPAIEDRDLAGKAKTIFCAEHDCIGPSTTAASYDDAAMQWNRRAGAAQAAPSVLLELADRIDTNQRSWLPISGHVVNVTFGLNEADAISAALRSLAAQPPAAPVETATKSAPVGSAPHNNGERLPNGDVAAAGADTRCSAATEHAKVADWLEDQARIATNGLHCGDNSAMIQQTHDWANKLEAAARHLRAVPQTSWQPIETAPKDGTLVLICGFGSEGYYVADAKWDGEWLLFHPDNDDHTEPSYNVSYWMPLPAPPSEVSRPEHRAPSASSPAEAAPSQRLPE
jgi:hypothetical protein